MTWQTFLFFAVAGLAFGYSGYRFSILFKLMKQHQGRGFRLDRIPERIVTAIVNVLGQRAVLRKRAAGIMHTTIFWGFLIITVGTLEQFVGTIYQGANFSFVGWPIYAPFLFLHDLFTFAILIALAYAAYRR